MASHRRDVERMAAAIIRGRKTRRAKVRATEIRSLPPATENLRRLRTERGHITESQQGIRRSYRQSSHPRPTSERNRTRQTRATMTTLRNNLLLVEINESNLAISVTDRRGKTRWNT